MQPIRIACAASYRELRVYSESDDPLPYGEISRAAFIGTNLLIGDRCGEISRAARFRGNTVNLNVWGDLAYTSLYYVCPRFIHLVSS